MGKLIVALLLAATVVLGSTIPVNAADWEVNVPMTGKWTPPNVPVEIELKKIEGSSVLLMYRWRPGGPVRDSGEESVTGTIDGNVIKFKRMSLAIQTEYTLTLKDDGTVDGKAIGSGILYTTFKKR